MFQINCVFITNRFDMLPRSEMMRSKRYEQPGAGGLLAVKKFVWLRGGQRLVSTEMSSDAECVQRSRRRLERTQRLLSESEAEQGSSSDYSTVTTTDTPPCIITTTAPPPQSMATPSSSSSHLLSPGRHHWRRATAGVRSADIEAEIVITTVYHLWLGEQGRGAE